MEGLWNDFSAWFVSLPGVGALHLDLMGRLMLASVLGGAVGWERERSGKPAGLRTNLLICVGAALITELSLRFPSFHPASAVEGGTVAADPSRVAAQIVSGIGFLGAGTIIQARGQVTGLTTAATLWVVAGIGMAVGTSAFVEATGATVLVLVTLFPLGKLERHIEESRMDRTLRIRFRWEETSQEELRDLLEEAGLRAVFESLSRDPSDGSAVVAFEVHGRQETYGRARSVLLRRDEILGLTESQ